MNYTRNIFDFYRIFFS